jgi:BRCT domain type II-containing protein
LNNIQAKRRLNKGEYFFKGPFETRPQKTTVMPPKAKAAVVGSTSNVYVVTQNNSVDSVYASPTSANERVTALKAAGGEAASIKVELHELKDGTVQASVSTEDKKPAPKDKAPKIEETKAPKASAAPKKTKTPAANAEKPEKATDADLPDKVKKLLAGTGDALSGNTVVVTGVPPTLGRKNAEKLVTSYGGKLTKSLSKNTNYVVVGNDAGPKKLEQIEELGIETLNEDALIAMLEKSASGGSGTKRGAEEGEKPVKDKKQKK